MVIGTTLTRLTGDVIDDLFVNQGVESVIGALPINLMNESEFY